MHQQTTDGARHRPALFISAHKGAMGNAHRRRVLPRKGKHGGVVQDQYRPRGCPYPLAGSMEVTFEDDVFLHMCIVQKPVGRFSIGPVLARHRDALTTTLPKIRRKILHASLQTDVEEPSPIEFVSMPA